MNPCVHSKLSGTLIRQVSKLNINRKKGHFNGSNWIEKWTVERKHARTCDHLWEKFFIREKFLWFIIFL